MHATTKFCAPVRNARHCAHALFPTRNLCSTTLDTSREERIQASVASVSFYLLIGTPSYLVLKIADVKRGVYEPDYSFYLSLPHESSDF
jgi:hypothetical protein